MTYAKEEARAKIEKLVEDFRAQEATLEKAPEAQIEQNFIRPLFRYLNWNTENKGLSHAHYEFRVQATNRKGLRPDTILHLDGRDALVMALVASMLEMHKAKSAAKTQSEQDVYARQIEATDRQIDELVYGLYGLTEEEIRIVEGKG